MMESSKRSEIIIKELVDLIDKNQSLRIGQLLVNIVKPKEPNSTLYYIEDDELLNRIEVFKKLKEE